MNYTPSPITTPAGTVLYTLMGTLYDDQGYIARQPCSLVVEVADGRVYAAESRLPLHRHGERQHLLSVDGELWHFAPDEWPAAVDAALPAASTQHDHMDPISGLSRDAIERNGRRTYDHYSVEGEPDTWTTHRTLLDAIARAEMLGVPIVWGTRYTASGGVDKRVVWAKRPAPIR